MKCMVLQNEGNIMDKEQDNDNNKEITQDKKVSSKSNFWENIAKEHPISVGIFCSIVASLIVSFTSSAIAFPSRLKNIENSIADINNNITTLVSNVSGIQEDINKMNEGIIGELNLMELKSDVDDLKLETSGESNDESNDIFSNNQSIQIIADNFSIINTQFSSIKDENFAIDLLFTSSTDVIAIDILTDTKYTVNDLMNKKLLLTYKEDSNDILFYGQFNENNHWNGNCIINVYNNDKLIAITEGLYDNGNLLQYKQAFVDTNSSGKEKWFVSSRVHTKDYNTGKTLQYNYTEYQKNFDFSNVTPKDIVDVDSFRLSLTSELESFYHGNTSNGQFNDDTNSAYYISYNDNSKSIKTLYVGNFKDGNFHDTTGKAWYITMAADTDYMYYIGKFEDGHPIEPETKKNFINPISLQQRNEIVKDMKFDCEIKWFDDTSTL